MIQSKWLIIFLNIFINGLFINLHTALLFADTNVKNMTNENEHKISGPLRIHETNPIYFQDVTGRAVYLTGSHTWANFQDRGQNKTITFNYGEYLDFLINHNHNFIRLWVWEQAAWATWTNDKILFHPLPYMRTGPGVAVDGGLKFDLNKFNTAYFDRLRSRVIAAQERNIYVSVMLFQGFSIERKETHKKTWLDYYIDKILAKIGIRIKESDNNNPWKGHPFNKNNNIDGINGDLNANGQGKEVHTLGISEITRLQESYVRKVIDTLNDLDNVLWEISNESHVGSTAWQYHMINYIKSYEKNKPKQHPVIMTVQWYGNNDTLFKSPADSISPMSYDRKYRNNPPANNGPKVIILDTDHLWGIGGNKEWVWKSFLRGHNPIFMDPYKETASRFKARDPKWDPIRRNMGYTLEYANRMNLAAMKPRGDLASTGYCLATNTVGSGAEYLVYLPSGGKIEVDISSTLDELKIEWLNPSSGKTINAGTALGGSICSFVAPFDGDAVLYLYAEIE